MWVSLSFQEDHRTRLFTDIHFLLHSSIYVVEFHTLNERKQNCISETLFTPNRKC